MLARTRVTALALALGVGLSSPCMALSVSPQGVGQVLLFPYYTVNGGNQTLISIANTTGKAKAVRVRFREGRNARAVMTFNVYLSPYDAWTAALYAADADGPTRLITRDRSCTVPAIDQDTFASFSSTSYTGAASDHPASLDATLSSPARTREGLIEVIELGNLRIGDAPTQLAEEVTHLISGVPRDCNAVLAAWAPEGAWMLDGSTDIDLPTGGLYGTASVVDVAEGTMFAYEATALARFFTNAQQPGALHREAPTSDLPNLRSADNGNSQILVDIPPDDIGGAALEAFVTDAPTPDAVSLVLLRREVMNEYTIDPSIGGATEWVVSFPTKGYYADVNVSASVRAPFTDAFRDDGKACEEYQPLYFDREERLSPRDYGSAIIDPPPPDGGPFAPTLCDVVNVIAFNQGTDETVDTTSILGARQATNADVRLITGELPSDGHGILIFDDPLTAQDDHRLIAPSSARVYAGLPVLGMSVIRAINANAQPGILASYGGAYRHRGAVRRLSP